MKALRSPLQVRQAKKDESIHRHVKEIYKLNVSCKVITKIKTKIIINN